MKFERMNKKILLLLTIPLLFSTQIFSQNKSDNIRLDDGYYLYSISRILDAVELEKIYNQSGVDVNIDVIQDFTELAIYINNRSFTDPSLGITIKVDKWGNLSSSDSPDLEGQMFSSGEMVWKGSVMEGEFIRFVENNCRLMPVSDSDHSDSSYNGVYFLDAEMFDQEMKVIIKDGFLTFEWLDSDQYKKLYGECALLVSTDGSFKYSMDILTRLTMRVSTYESITDSITTTIQDGRVSPTGGLVFNYVIRTSSGTDTMGMDNRQVYAGLKVADSEQSNGSSPVFGRISPPDRSSCPDWYINVDYNPDKIIATGAHSNGNKETALRLAEITATSNMSYQIQTKIRSYLNDTQVSSTLNNLEIGNITEVIEQISVLFFPVTLDKSIYIPENKTAYVQVSISDKMKKKVLKELFEKNRIDSDFYIN